MSDRGDMDFTLERPHTESFRPPSPSSMEKPVNSDGVLHAMGQQTAPEGTIGFQTSTAEECSSAQQLPEGAAVAGWANIYRKEANQSLDTKIDHIPKLDCLSLHQLCKNTKCCAT